MCSAHGYRVVTLVRTRIMHIRLGDLPVGKWRHLTPKERDELLTAVGLRQETPGKDRVSARSGRAGATGEDSVLAGSGRGGGNGDCALRPPRSFLRSRPRPPLTT